MPPHILIIGAGIGGLALVHGLKNHNIPFHIYERDHTSNYRAQGYRLRFNAPAAEALRYLLDEETWRLFELTCAESKMGGIPEIDATTAKVSVARSPAPPPNGSMKGSKPPRPYTVDRTLFREVLLRGLDEHVSYGKAFSNYTIDGGVVKVSFTDGSAAEGTLLIGADGKNSVVRKQHLPDFPIKDTGGCIIYGKTPLTPELVESLNPAAMHGISAIKDRSREQIITMVLEAITFSTRSDIEKEGFACPQDYIYWGMVAQTELLGSAKDEAPCFTTQQAEALAVELAESWHPSVRPIITEQAPNQTAVLRIDSCPPDLGTWQPNEHVTLIGDAIHPTIPAGSGAIQALRDAHSLCRSLGEEGQSVEAIGKYEAEMRAQASPFVSQSLEMGEALFKQTRASDRNIGEMMMELRVKRMGVMAK